MKKQTKKTGLLRRVTALALAITAAGMLGCAADWDAARTALSRSGATARGLLELELGRLRSEDELDAFAGLVVGQSPLLASRKEEISSRTAETSADASEEEAALPEEEPEETAAESSQSAEEPARQEQEPESDASGSVSKEASPSGEKEEDPADEDEPLDLSAIAAEQLEVDNHTANQSAKVEKYWLKTPSLTLRPAEEGPQILLMHTHATESYTMADGDNYEESDESRTTDENHNMIRVGEEMKAVFEEMGFSVLHDKTAYDYPGYNGSYGRSLAGVQEYLEQYPTIGVVLDVHRDALIGSDGTAYAKTTVIDGEEVAQVMLVVGTDDGGLTHPDWRDNYTLALKIQASMLTIDSSLPRAIDLRSQRFNQHLTAGSLLVEVGTSGNTLRQALAGARLFARAAGELYSGYIAE